MYVLCYIYIIEIVDFIDECLSYKYVNKYKRKQIKCYKLFINLFIKNETNIARQSKLDKNFLFYLLIKYF